MTTTPPRVSVIIPALDAEVFLPSCLDALRVQDTDASFEILVVDNGSRDRTCDLALEHGVQLLHEPLPTSYAARNRGVAAARGEVLAFLDADCIPGHDWIRQGLSALASSGEDTIVAGAIAVTTGDRPTFCERYDQVKYLRQDRAVSERTAAATANLWVRKDLLERLSGFDASLPSGGDEDFCLRARKLGARIVYGPEARVSHPARGRFSGLARKSFRIGRGCAARARKDRFPMTKLLLMLLVFLPRKRFLLEALSPRPEKGRGLLVGFFLLDWVLKVFSALGIVRGLVERTPHERTPGTDRAVPDAVPGTTTAEPGPRAPKATAR
jgi:glycosyltransferase involved in cell wall biosynthesis